jgi:predicted metal-dependent phosphoesterase TrpH
MARLAQPRWADLHVHTTASDGAYTSSQVVALARQAGLCAVAVTDHDTLAGVASAVACAQDGPGPAVEVVPGVEITTSFDGREFHLLGYFVRPDDPALTSALNRLCERRRDRFCDYIAKLAEKGYKIPGDRACLAAEGSVSLGRRHVAGLLLDCGFARTQNEAFHRFIGPLRDAVIAKEMLPIADAIGLVHDAGGVASLAHPPPDLTDDAFARLQACGLDALEAEYAWRRSSPGNRLREVAARLGLAITGGSDCHGPDPACRRIGTYAITAEALEKLRALRGARTGVISPGTESGVPG